MAEDRIDEIMLGLPKKEKIKIIKIWKEYLDNLPKEGKKILKRRITWLKKSMKKKKKWEIINWF